MRMRPAVSAVALAAALLLLGCQGGGRTAPSPTPATQVTGERQGVRLTLSVGRETYGPGESVDVKASVENTNDGPITYATRNQGDPPIYMRVVSEVNGDQNLHGPADPTVLPGAIAASLDPHGKLTREVSWDQVLDTYQTPVQAPPGKYTIKAEFLLGQYAEGQMPVPVTASANFHVEGSEPIITPQEAIQSAVLMPEVRSWLESKGGGLFCALAKRGLFYNVNPVTGEPFESFDFLYQGQIQNGLAICSPVTEDGAWRVLFSATKGPPPSRISAFLDIHNGTPLRVEEGGPSPAASP